MPRTVWITSLPNLLRRLKTCTCSALLAKSLSSPSTSASRSDVETVRPAMVSVALREIIAEPDEACTTRFFSFCAEASIAVQHILYTAAEVDALAGLIARGVVAKSNLQILHVLGRYSAGQVSGPADLDRPLARQTAVHLSADWAVCAFGQAETPCLLQALRAGGKVRVGFENNILHLDGTIARDNADRVRSMIQSAQAEGLPL